MNAFLKATLGLIFIFFLSVDVSSQSGNDLKSRGEKNAYDKLYTDRIQGLSDMIQSEIKALEKYFPTLQEKYKDSKAHYYTNQYPFANPNAKYWTKKEEAFLTFQGGSLVRIEFIISEQKEFGGEGFQKTFITDPSPLDNKLEDIEIKFVDYIIRQNSYTQKLGDIKDLESRAQVLSYLYDYYNHLSKSIEKDYFRYKQSLRDRQRKMLGNILN